MRTERKNNILDYIFLYDFISTCKEHTNCKDMFSNCGGIYLD